MKYLVTLWVLIPLTSTAQNIGIYIDTAGQVAIGNDTVWEPFQVFTDAGSQIQLDQQSAEMGNTSGLLITPTVEAGQSFTCGLSGELASVSLRLGTVINAGNTMLELNIRDGSAPTSPVIATSSFAISDDELLWYDIPLTPSIDVLAGDEFFIEVVHTSGSNAEWDWVDGTDPYAGGTSWQHQSSWFEISSSDLVFRTYVVAALQTDVLSVTSSGKVRINDYLMPPSDGLNNQVIVTNGTGVLSWQNIASGGVSSLIQDADGDTKVQVEESADEDIIRFDLAGTEYMVLRKNANDQPRLELIDPLQNTFVGVLTGNANTTGYSNTATGSEALFSNTEGLQNVAIGFKALYSNTEGINNTAIGGNAIRFNIIGSDNTAIGRSALFWNTGSYNTATGYYALFGNTNGELNTANGHFALSSNTMGYDNTASGSNALISNVTGSRNTAVGSSALYANSAGSHATAIGYNAMRYANNTTTPFDNHNVAVGYEALRGSGVASANTGNENTAIGYQTLANNSTGSANTASGSSALSSNTTGFQNTAVGSFALDANITGINNTAIGAYGLNANSTGHYNTATGYRALYYNTEGSWNTACGTETLHLNTVGDDNLALGDQALRNNTIGNKNTANGVYAMLTNTAGSGATAIGYGAMRYSNSTGTPFDNYNVAIGNESLRGSTVAHLNTGNFNTAIGYHALLSNTSGSDNTANGYQALAFNTTGNFNTATGFEALVNNEEGLRNTATGHSALKNNIDGDNNTAVGIFALENNTTGNNNTALGYSAHSNPDNVSNSTGLGYDADPLYSNEVIVGNASVTFIGGAVNWAIASDRRFKSDIAEDVAGLDFINALRPVTYNIDLDAILDWKALHYNTRDSSEYPEKNEIETYRFSGFIAQEVESASRNAGYDFSGVCPPKNEKDTYALRYAEFVVPLVKAVQELSEENESLKATNETLMNLLTSLQQRVESLELSASQGSGH